MHSAQDIDFYFQADFISRKLSIAVDLIDTALLESFICMHAAQILNVELEKVNKLPPLINLDNFEIELIVASSARFSVQYALSEIDYRHNTLIIKVLKS